MGRSRSRSSKRVTPSLGRYYYPSVRRISVTRGALSPYGYAKIKSKSAARRHAALDRAVRATGNPLGIYKAVLARRNFNAARNPRVAALMRADANYVKRRYGI
jgi:hypothetical protein